MTKEIIYSVPTQVEPYRTYYAERNGNVAKYIADILGYSFLGLVEPKDSNNYYLVPPKTLTKEEMRELRIRNEQDFYGLAIDDVRSVDKQVFQLGLDDNVFAQKVRSVVLPGFRARNSHELNEATLKMLESHGRVRIKRLGVSDGRGQKVIQNEYDLLNFQIEENEVVVIEPDLDHKKTISVGKVILGKNEYAFVAHQTNDIAPEDGRDRYTGADPVKVVKGSMNALLEDTSLGQDEIVAITKSIKFDNLFNRQFRPVASRLSYDVLFGLDGKRAKMVGITDITGRLGGTCPAVVLAISKMITDGVGMGRSRVYLNYKTEDRANDASEVFLDHETLKITAEIYE